MITHISLDLDNTLITTAFDHHLWNEWLPRQCATQHRVPLDLAREHVFGEYYAAQYIERIPNWTSIDYWLKRFHLTNDGLDTLAKHITLFEDAIPALEALARDHELLLCTANDETLLQLKLDATRIRPYFSHVISVPSRYGTWKKNSTTYERMLNDLGLRPEHVLHVGNDTHQDHDSPKAIGIHALLLDRTGKKPGSISTLRQLVDPRSRDEALSALVAN